jgi:hypothetical protein
MAATKTTSTIWTQPKTKYSRRMVATTSLHCRAILLPQHLNQAFSVKRLMSTKPNLMKKAIQRHHTVRVESVNHTLHQPKCQLMRCNFLVKPRRQISKSAKSLERDNLVMSLL